jgi:hypothetical protein
LQVLRLSVGASPGLAGPIVILDLAGARSVVHLETRRAGAFLNEEPHITATKLAWQRLRALAGRVEQLTADCDLMKEITTSEGLTQYLCAHHAAQYRA